MKSINPATEEVMKEFKALTQKEAFNEIKKTRSAFKDWSELDIKTRCKYLRKVSGILKRKSRKYGEVITKEMGKPITQARAEVEKCAWVCEYYAKNAEKFLSDEIIKTEAKKSYITFQPLGIILGIMPWNFPFWQVFRFCASALAAGNCIVIKHASNVPQCSLKIEEIFKKANLPDNVFRSLLVTSDAVKPIIENDLVDGISLTGSIEAGKKIGELAGKKIKKAVLELGGNDPFIVLRDAGIKFTCNAGIKARFQNTGQSCIAAKRFIVHKEIADEFKDKFIKFTKELVVGDPMDKETDIGPLARDDLRDKLEQQIRRAITQGTQGAKILTGGRRIKGKGYFFEPTLMEAKKGNRIVRDEEIFGPAAAIITGRNDEELIEIANATEFGLGASLWSSNLKKAERFAYRLQAGIVSINDLVKSDPRLPFGGIKKSGIGRELSEYGIKEFVNIKSIVVNDF